MPISRFYHAPEDAQVALVELRQAGFRPSALHVIAPAEATTEAIQRRGVAAAQARQYASLVRGGLTLVLVDFALGYAGIAIAILEKPRPGDRGAQVATYERLGYDPATPLSSWFGWPVLSSDPAPLARLLNLRTLSPAQTAPRSSFGMPTLSANPAPLSSLLGMRVLSDTAAPLSSGLGQPVLSPRPTPLSSWLGWRVLSPEAAPFSRWLGRRVLSRDAAPFSGWLGLKLLSRDPAPLSRLLGLKVLSRDPPQRG